MNTPRPCALFLMWALLNSGFSEGQSPDDWQTEFLRPVDDPKDVHHVPFNLTKMMLLALERVYNPQLKEDDPMLNPAIREQLRAQGFSIDGRGFAGGGPADDGREAGLRRIRKAHRSETIPLADDFEPGYPELWDKVAGGMVSPDCGSVEGEALCFDQDDARSVVTAALRLIGGATVRFALWMSPTDEPAPVVLEFQTSGSDAWQRVARFDPQSYRMPAPSNPNSKSLESGDASDHRGFIFFSVPLSRTADSGATKLRWMQLWESDAHSGNSTLAPASWALDNISVELNAAARPAVILTVSEDVGANGSSMGLVSVVAQFSEPVIGFDRLRVKASGGTVASVSRLTGTIAGQGEMYSVHVVPQEGSEEVTLQILEGAGVTKGGSKSMASNSVVVMLDTSAASVHQSSAESIDLEATGFDEEQQSESHGADELAAGSNVIVLQAMQEMQTRIEYLEREVRRLQQVETDLAYLKSSLLRRF